MKVSDCIVDFPYRFQLRCVLKVPIVVLQPNTLLQGSLRMIAHERQSYDVHVSLEGPPVQFGMPEQKSSGNFDLKEPYYRQLTSWYVQQGQQQQVLQTQQQAPLAAGFMQPGVGVVSEGVQSPQWQQHQQYQQQQHQPYQQQQQQYQQQQHRTYSSRVNGHIG
eukprot:jgi/Chrzof1/8380/Cz03g08130.t1